MIKLQLFIKLLKKLIQKANIQIVEAIIDHYYLKC